MMQLVLSVEILPYARYAFFRCTGNEITPDQESDLIHLCSHRKSGLAASRGYGKTLLAVIIESFLASRGWLVCHEFNALSQASAWYHWYKKLGWEVTQWHCSWGNFVVHLRLYSQGRGPRVDAIFNDEIGTVISEIERNDFAASQEMLSGSQLGFAKYMGTRDPNSIWTKYDQCTIIRPYDEVKMPWVKMQYNDAKLHNPAWYMDCEYHMKATASGGKVMEKITVQQHNYKSTRYGIDSNPKAGYYLVGTAVVEHKVYVCEAMRFDTLSALTKFIYDKQRSLTNVPLFELEMNGPGGVVAQHLLENHCTFIEDVVTETSKIARISAIAYTEVIIKPEFSELISNVEGKIWKDKKVAKNDDDHWFDSLWHSVGEMAILDIPKQSQFGTRSRVAFI